MRAQMSLEMGALFITIIFVGLLGSWFTYDIIYKNYDSKQNILHEIFNVTETQNENLIDYIDDKKTYCYHTIELNRFNSSKLNYSKNISDENYKINYNNSEILSYGNISPYWVEQNNYLWTIVNISPDYDTTIYVINNGSEYPNGSEVFLLFDDFNTDLNENIWNLEQLNNNTYVINDSYLTINGICGNNIYDVGIIKSIESFDNITVTLAHKKTDNDQNISFVMGMESNNDDYSQIILSGNYENDVTLISNNGNGKYKYKKYFHTYDELNDDYWQYTYVSNQELIYNYMNYSGSITQKIPAQFQQIMFGTMGIGYGETTYMIDYIHVEKNQMYAPQISCEIIDKNTLKYTVSSDHNLENYQIKLDISEFDSYSEVYSVYI